MAPIKELVIERTYAAPVAQVWQAWTDPEMLKQWWGPGGVSIPECEVDLRVGGRLYIVMEAGEALGPYKGTRWPMEGTFTVVEPRATLTYTAQAWTDGKKEETTIDQVTEVRLSEDHGKTKVAIKATVHKIGPGARAAIQGMEYGFNQQMDKLVAFLKQ